MAQGVSYNRPGSQQQELRNCKSSNMTALTQQQAFAALRPEKEFCNDNEMSTVSGASSSPLSLPSSPSKVWPATPGESPVEIAVVPTSFETLADLPSLGSLGHFAGQCSRCCF